jgi:hypothetical protein
VGIGLLQAGLAGALSLLALPALAQGVLAQPLDASPRERADAVRAASDAMPTQVLPVWSSGSGRIEALLLIDTPLPTAPRGTLDNLLAPNPQVGGFGLRGRAALGAQLGLNLDLRPAAPPAMALLCEGNIGLAVALGRLAEPCLLAQLDAAGQVQGFGRGQNLGVSLDWQTEGGGLDLSFGLSWLNARDDRSALSAFLPAFEQPSPLLPPSLLGAWELQGQEFNLQGQHWMTPRSWLRVEGRHGSNRLTGYGLPMTWDSTSLSLSGGYRAFSGSVTGRLIEIDQPRQAWTDVDVALSWRTPWDARVSVGARNLLGGPDRERWPLATLPGMPESEARTPYVRYHQDL